MAEQHNFNIDQGTTWNRTITWTDSNNDPIDLSGYTARMKLKRQKGSATADLTLTTENDGIAIDALNGAITLSLSPIQTAGLDSSYVYDLEVVSGAGDVTRLLQGRIIVDGEVTT